MSKQRPKYNNLKSGNNRADGRLLKCLSAAIYAGGMFLAAAQPTYASGEIDPLPVLDVLHNSGAMIPETTNVYPSSEYTLNKITPTDPSNLPANVVRYYDPNSFGADVQYYEVNFKSSVFGEGESEKYYKWSKTGLGLTLVETSNPAEACITVKSDPGNPLEPIRILKDETRSDISETITGTNIYNFVDNRGTIKNISSKFVGNSVTIPKNGGYNYTAIIAEADSPITNINSSFIANDFTLDSDGAIVHATLIKAFADIDNIRSEFIGNNISGIGDLDGGLVQITTKTTTKLFQSDFLANTVDLSAASTISGGVLSVAGTIEELSNSKFISNSAHTQSGSIHGAAVYNADAGIIGTIDNTVFIDNYAKSDSGNVYGGAFSNTFNANIKNSIFKGNIAESTSGRAYGGALYTNSSLTISATDGKTTEFTDNYVINGATKENQGIYVDSTLATLTLEANDGGKIVLNDEISGVRLGYNAHLTGNGLGTINLYNNISNAKITADNVNISTVNNALYDYDFVSLTSDDSVKFAIDLNFGANKSDTFNLGQNSLGTFYVNDFNLIGDLPTVTTAVKVLTGGNSVELKLSDDLINSYSKTTRNDEQTVKDTLKATTLFSDEYFERTSENVRTEGLRAVSTTAGRTAADTIEYFVTEEREETGVTKLGTLKYVMSSDGNYNFSAETINDKYTLADGEGGIVLGTGSKTIAGRRSGDTMSIIDANGQSLFVIDEGSNANLTLRSLKITNVKDEDGAVLNNKSENSVITLGGSQGEVAIVIDGPVGKNGIINNGKLILNTNYNTFTTNTGITGDGTLEFNMLSNPCNFYLTDGASIKQKKILVDFNLIAGMGSTLEGEILIASKGYYSKGQITIEADGLLSPVTMYNGNLYLNGGTLSQEIGGTGGNVNFQANTLIDADIYRPIVRGAYGAVITTLADHLKGGVSDGYGYNLTLTGGDLSSKINGAASVVIDGDVNIVDGGSIVSSPITIHEDSTLTTNASSIDRGITNNGTLYLNGGSINYDISGTDGEIYINDNVTVNGYKYLYGTLNVNEGAKLTLNRGDSLKTHTVINDSIIEVRGDSLSQASFVTNGIRGQGYVYIPLMDGKYVNSNALDIYQELHIDGNLAGTALAKLHDDVIVNEGGSLTLTAGADSREETINIKGDGTTYTSKNFELTDKTNIETNLVISSSTLSTVADNLNNAKSITNNATINLKSGTLTNNVSGTGTVVIGQNQDVIIDSIISSTGGLTLSTYAHATISADNLQTTANIGASFTVLNLKDGTLNYDILNSYVNSMINIIGDVKLPSKRIATPLTVTDTGKFTAPLGNVTGSITNNGEFYTSGILAKAINGSGTTFIDGVLTLADSNAKIVSNLNLYDGKLVDSGYIDSTNALRYNLGTVTGEGDLAIAIDMNRAQKSSQFNLNSASDGIFYISGSDITFVNFPDEQDPTSYEKMQVLFNAGDAQLSLKSAAIAAATEKDWEDVLTKPDIYYDEPYNKYHSDGIIHGELGLATTQTDNDSIVLKNMYTTWEDTTTETGDVLCAWAHLDTDQDRHFRFRTASDIYRSQKSIDVPTNGNMTIHGVYEEETGDYAEWKIGSNDGFKLTNANQRLDIYDLDITQTGGRVVEITGGGHLGVINPDGTVDGGLVNVVYDNSNAGMYRSADFIYINGKTSYISQIADSSISNNTFNLTPPDPYSIPEITGGLISITGDAKIGNVVTDDEGNNTYYGGLINLSMNNNNMTFAGNVNGALMYVKGNISQIKDSEFLNNTTNKSSLISIAYGSKIHKIENTKFIGNTANGSLISAYANAIDLIKDCIFENTNENYTGSAFGTAPKELIGTTIKDFKAPPSLSGTQLIKDSHFINISGNNDGGGFGQGTNIGKVINTTVEGGHGSSGGIQMSGSLSEIHGSIFKNNSAGNQGGIFYSVGGLTIIDDTKFIGNYAAAGGGGAFKDQTITTLSNSYFEGNHTTGQGGIANGKTFTTIINNEFKENYAGSDAGGFANATITDLSDSTFTGNHSGRAGGVFYNTTIGSIINCTFEGNYASGEGGVFSNLPTLTTLRGSTFKENYAKQGGVFSINTNKKVENIIDCEFIGNYSTEGSGGAISRYGSADKGVLQYLTASTFKENHATVNGGAVCGLIMTKISDSDFEGNHSVFSGGAICLDQTVTEGIVNTNFVDNYTKTTSSNGVPRGGAIYTSVSQSIISTGEDKLSKFTGNYVQKYGDGEKLNEAIFVNNATSTLTLNANTGGRIWFDDYINGKKGYNVVLTGDEDGTISLYNNIMNANVSADSVNVDFADGEFFDYDFLKLTSNASAKYIIDVDFENEIGDTITVGTGSSGTILVNALNLISSTDEYKTVHVLNSSNSDIQLALSNEIEGVVENVRETSASTVYNTDLFHQQEGLATSSTCTRNDSITHFLEEDVDAFNVIASNTFLQNRQFVFQTDDKYTVSGVLADVATGSLGITGYDATKSELDLNDQTITLSENSTVTINNTIITTSADNAIELTNNDAKLVLNGSEINGGISGIGNNIDIVENATKLNGLVTNVNVNLNGGELQLGAPDVLSGENTVLNTNNGTLNLANGVVENNIINKIMTNVSSNYILDIDLKTQTGDEITVLDNNTRGWVPITDINWLNNEEIPDDGDPINFNIHVLHPALNWTFLLRVNDDELRTTIRDITRVEEDTIAEVTNFDDEYFVRSRNGVLYGAVTVGMKLAPADSLHIVVDRDWESGTTIVESMGDTLRLVNTAENDTQKLFKSADSSDIYKVHEDLGVTNGSVRLMGTISQDNGVILEQSTVVLDDYRGFELESGSDLVLDGVRLYGNNGIVTGKSTDSMLTLSNATIEGAIKGDGATLPVEVKGLYYSTINGTLENVEVKLLQGGLAFNTDTFADAGSKLIVNNGTMMLGNGEFENYEITNLESGQKSKYNIDINIVDRTSDTITVTNGKGSVVLDSFNISGDLSNLDYKEEYLIQIVKSPNSEIQLDLSESIKSYLDYEMLLGTEEIATVDTVKAETNCLDEYAKRYQEVDIRGYIDLATKDTQNDSLLLYKLRMDPRPGGRVELGDTLVLWSKLKTDEDRSFVFNNSTETYQLKDNIEAVATDSAMSIIGKSSGSGEDEHLSAIDMNKYTGFQLKSGADVSVENIAFEDLNYKNGALFKISATDAELKLNNVKIGEENTVASNAIENLGTIKMTGGKVILNSGILGTGITRVEGSDVYVKSGVKINQSTIMVDNGSLTVSVGGKLNADLSIGTSGVATMDTNAISSAVVNAGIFNITGGDLGYQVSGEGTTRILGSVKNNTIIDQDVDIRNGRLTTTTAQLGAGINNDAELMLSGELDKVITGAGTTYVDAELRLDKESSLDGTLDLNDGKVYTDDDCITTYEIGKILNNGSIDIDIDFNAERSDKFVVGSDSSGLLLIENLNFLNTDKYAGDSLIQVLETNGTDTLQIALSESLTNEAQVIGRTIRDEADAVKAVAVYSDTFHNYERGGTIKAMLSVDRTSTLNDSIRVSTLPVEWDAEREETGIIDDTLLLWNRLDSSDKSFTADGNNLYTVSNLVEGLGETKGDKLSLNGVSASETEKSTIDLNGKTGFELVNSTELSINNTKLTNGKDNNLISVSNEDASIKLNNSYIDGNITGTVGYNIEISGDSVTTLNGVLTNASGNLISGILKLNEDTFKHDTDNLDVQGGVVALANESLENYIINELTSDESARYDLDIDYSLAKADMLSIETNGSGTVVIRDLNSLGEVAEGTAVGENYRIQILNNSENSALELALSSEAQNILDAKEFYVKQEAKTRDTELQVENAWDKKYHKEDYTIDYYGKLIIDETTKDSLIISITRPQENQPTEGDLMGDTLALINSELETEETRKLIFDAYTNEYEVKDDLGVSTEGSLTIVGKSKADGTEKSKLNLDGHDGFELANKTELTLSDVEFKGKDTLVTVSEKSASVVIEDSFIRGDIVGELSEDDQFDVTLKGDQTTKIDGKFTKADVTLESGNVEFNVNTFADTNDSLTTIGGKITLSNDVFNEEYIINELNSSELTEYAIDIDLTNKVADTIKVVSGEGVVTLDQLNISGAIENAGTDYKIQILDNGGSSLSLALSDNAKAQLKTEYLIDTQVEITYDEVQEQTKWDAALDKYRQEFYVYGKLDVVDVNGQTRNGLGIVESKVVDGVKEDLGRYGDTLRLVNNAVNVSEKEFIFDTSYDKYVVEEDLGITSGSVTVKGVLGEENRSTIDWNGEHTGFEVGSDTKLKIENVELVNANGASGSVIKITDSDAQVELINVNLRNNHATSERGAAIYSVSDVTITSDGIDSEISGNETVSGDEAIYMETDTTLTLNVVNDGKLNLSDKINGEDYSVKITGDNENSAIVLDSSIDNASVELNEVRLHLLGDNNLVNSDLTINSGVLDLVNDRTQQQQIKSLTVAGDFKLNVDVDLKNVVMDRLPEGTIVENGSWINVDRINLLSDTKEKSVAIPFAHIGYKDSVRYIGPSELSDSTQVTTVYAPIYKYNLRYENKEDLGYFVFSRNHGSDAYNPAVLASPVATQSGATLTMNQTFNYAFQNSDNFMMIPHVERLAKINANRYVLSNDGTQDGIFSPLYTQTEENSIWVKTYATFETVPLRHGPKVNNTAYGTLVGFDTGIENMRRGWNRVWTGYIGYNGINQSYSGTSAIHNGGLFGGTVTLYKGNFFNATTLSTGANIANGSNMYGHEDITMLMAGVGNKTGYNIELNNGKYIIQPNLLISYTFVNTFDYTNSAKIRIKSDPLHSIQLAPGIKFVGNFKSGWQPYLGVNMVWNVMDRSRVYADGERLPELGIKPYIQYGLGVQKRIKDHFMAYGQAMIQNGGRNGISLTAGFRWAVGHECHVEKVDSGKTKSAKHEINVNTKSKHIETKSVKTMKQPIQNVPVQRKTIKSLNPIQQLRLDQTTSRTNTYGVIK